MASMTHHQLRAARTLLFLQQEMLAYKANIGITTLRLFENGNRVGEEIVERLRKVVEAEGAVLVAPDTVVDGVRTGGGVLLKHEDDLPDETAERLAAFRKTSLDAAKSSDRTGVGRRARVPITKKASDRYRNKPDEGGGGQDGAPPR